MNVLFLTSWYPTTDMPTRGIFVQEHAKAASLYDDVRVLHLKGEDRGLAGMWVIENEPDPDLTAGLPTWRVRHGRPLPKSGLPLYVASAFAAYRQATADGFAPDVLHAHLYSAGVAAVVLGRILRLPVVITEHSTAFQRGHLDRRELRLSRFAFHGSDVVCPVSTVLKQAIENYGIRTRFTVVPNVVDTAVFRPAERQHEASSVTRFLFVALLGGSDDRKGIKRLLRTLSTLRDGDGDNWTLDVLGDGNGRADFERLAASLRLADRVTFHGFQPKTKVAEWMNHADLLVHPTTVETFSIVVAEALSTGLPVLASATGEIPQLIGQTGGGIIVDPHSEHDLRAALHRVLLEGVPFDRDEIATRAPDLSPRTVGLQLHGVYGVATEVRQRLRGARTMRSLSRVARRSAAVDTLYERVRYRALLWKRILRSLKGRSVADSWVLYASAAVDTLGVVRKLHFWAPRTIAGAHVIDRTDGTILRVRGRTDDIYLALPGREGAVDDLIVGSLRHADTIVDGGAHIGYYSIRAARIVGPKGKVIAVEANPETASALRSNISLNQLDNVEVVAVALGRSDGETELIAPAGILGTTSVHPPRYGPGYPVPRSVGTVPRRTLDQVCQGVGSIRLLKLDIEGSELAAIEGGHETLGRTDLIVVERDRDPDPIERSLRAEGFETRTLPYTTYLAAARPDSATMRLVEGSAG